MQPGKHGQALGAGLELVGRQGKRQKGKAEGIKRQHPVQANDFLGRQQREKHQGHHHQASQQALRTGRAHQRLAVPERQPQCRRRDEVSHHGEVNEGLAPFKRRVFVAVVDVEHDVRPAMRHVVGNVDGRAGQGAHHQQRQPCQPLAPVKNEVHEVSQAQHHREIFRQEGAAQKHARHRIQPVSRAVKLGPALGPHEGGHRQHRPENQRRVGGDDGVEPVQRCQPEK